MNTEIIALLSLKDHFAAEATSLENRLNDRQELADRFYLRAKFAALESTYALAHVTKGTKRVPDGDLEQLVSAPAQLGSDVQSVIRELVLQYQLFQSVSRVPDEELNDLISSLNDVEPSPEAKSLIWAPSGSVFLGRKVLLDEGAEKPRYFDVELGRYLTPNEAEELAANSGWGPD